MNLVRLRRFAVYFTLAVFLLVVFSIVVFAFAASRLTSPNTNKAQYIDLTEDSDIPQGLEVARDIEFANPGGRSLRLHILRPAQHKGTMPAVVWIHGGSWHSGSKDKILHVLGSLAQEGFVIVSIDYRLSGEATFPAQIHDCKCAVRWLRAHSREYSIDPNRIGACGESAGGHLAALLGTSPGVKNLEGDGGSVGCSSRVQAVVDLFGPTDFLKIGDGFGRDPISKAIAGHIAASANSPVSRLVGGPIHEREDICRKANPITYVGKGCPPFLILHGDKDVTVPLDQSRLLYRALADKGMTAEFHIVRNAGHEFRDETADIKVLDFFRKHLGD